MKGALATVEIDALEHVSDLYHDMRADKPV